MIERFTLKIPPGVVAEAVTEIERLLISGNYTTNIDFAKAAAAKCAEIYAPQMQMNWGADKKDCPLQPPSVAATKSPHEEMSDG